MGDMIFSQQNEKKPLDKMSPDGIHPLAVRQIPILQSVKNPMTITLHPQHEAVLQGLAMRNPYLSFSDIVGIGLEPFIHEHIDAAGEDTLFIETARPATTLV